MARLKRTLLVGATMLASCNAPNPKEKLLEEAHSAVRDLLRDPDSAQFDDKLAQVFPEAGIVCQGEVNSKNGFGGYTGLQGYAFSRTDGAATEENPKLMILVMKKCTAEIEVKTAETYRQIESAKQSDGPI